MIEHFSLYFYCSVGGKDKLIHDHPTNILFKRVHEEIIFTDVILGSAPCPSGLMRVKTDICDYLVQVFYDLGAQVSICNSKWGPLVVHSRTT